MSGIGRDGFRPMRAAVREGLLPIVSLCEASRRGSGTPRPLVRRTPQTAITTIVGALALTGVWPFSEFFSKEAILAP